MAELPIIMTADGPVPTDPTALRNELVAIAVGLAPGLTTELPASLIEDVASTDTGALVVCDQARVDLINSLTPRGANAFLLSQLGAIYGTVKGKGFNTSVLVVFTGTPGFVIAKGFTVSDGQHQYIIQDGGVIASGGESIPLFALASDAGTWAVPANSVNQLITSVPTGTTLTVTNPEAGTPSSDPQTESSYRSQVLQDGLAVATGLGTTLRKYLARVPGVQPRLVRTLQQIGGGWRIIVGGGDPYEVANAIYMALFDVSTLVGSMLNVTNITTANPGVVTTNLNHGFATGQVITITDVVGMTGINGVPKTITVLSEKTFSIGDTTGDGSYVSGGVVSPNLRNVTVDISDYPDVYGITYVNPPQQGVTVLLTWNTSSLNFVSDAAIAQLGAPALVDYINSVNVGAPLNLFEMQETFLRAISGILTPDLVTRMVFAVSINGVSTPPDAGTGIIEGDPESYFLTTVAGITIVRG